MFHVFSSHESGWGNIYYPATSLSGPWTMVSMGGFRNNRLQQQERTHLVRKLPLWFYKLSSDVFYFQYKPF
jgi:hypothetical protein